MSLDIDKVQGRGAEACSICIRSTFYQLCHGKFTRKSWVSTGDSVAMAVTVNRYIRIRKVGINFPNVCKNQG